jgi:long-subunit fatty acid transport protein
MLKRPLFYYIVVLTVSILVLGDGAEAGFKFGGASARAMGMGGAFTAVADDASALYYNPAGLSQIIHREGIFTHAKKFDVLSLDFIGIASERIGISYIAHSAELESKEHGDTEMREATFGISIARKIYPKVALGATLKAMVMESVVGNDRGFGMDLGAIYRYNEQTRFGLSCLNAGARVRGEEVPFQVTAGVAYELPDRPIMVVFDLFSKEDYGTNGTIGYRLGAEMTLKDVVGLRAGLNDGNLACGAGINQQDWGFDGAYVHNRALDLAQYYFSAKLRF